MSAERYELDEWRKPKIEEGEKELFSEPGRVLPGGSNYSVDYRSHWFVVTKGEYGGYALHVKHGGGQERVKLPYFMLTLAPGFAELTSDQRFLLFWALLDVHHNAQREAKEIEAGRYRVAFVEGRLKKRKYPRQATIKVWIEPKKMEVLP